MSLFNNLKKSLLSLACVLSLTLSAMGQTQDYLIIANGSPIPKETLIELSKNKIVIALDGAANHLRTVQIAPHIILGDLDSITVDTKTLWQLSGAQVVHTPDQDYTDLHKGIMFCDEHHARSIMIINAIGGDRTDHMIANISLLRRCYKADRPLSIITDNEILEFVKDRTLTIHGKPHDQCAIIGFTHATVTTHGLEYEMDNYELYFTERASTSNRILKESATIQVSGEALVIHPLHLNTEENKNLYSYDN